MCNSVAQGLTENYKIIMHATVSRKSVPLSQQMEGPTEHIPYRPSDQQILSHLSGTFIKSYDTERIDLS
jgi:hypothetical protein